MNKTKIIRVATYLRVSHEDQKKFGDSIATQRQHLEKFLEDNPNMIHVDEYSDEGVSANKLTKRIQLQRLLYDIEDNKIDLVIFTKLDRWFRSVAKYYKIQEVLEAHNVAWQAILEDYETVTANGKFKVNIMLSVAQQERDRTSERIKDVFQYKISQGQTILPANCLHFPFTVQEIDGVKRVVHDPETEEMAYDWLNHLKTHNSIRLSTIYLNEKYDKSFNYGVISATAKDPLLYGCYKDNENYCEPYITKEEFMTLQENLKKNVRVRKTNHVYVFSGKIRCPLCGEKMVGGYAGYKTLDGPKKSFYYKCNYAYQYRHVGHIRACSFTRSFSEPQLEKKIVENLEKYIEDYILEKEAEQKKQAPIKNLKKEKRKLEEELDRLNKMYQKGRIKEENYDKEYDELEGKIKKLVSISGESQYDKKNIDSLKALLETDLKEQYYKADKLTRQAFWNSIIKEIIIDENKEIQRIIFLA